jgi:hypothetical protein
VSRGVSDTESWWVSLLKFLAVVVVMAAAGVGAVWLMIVSFDRVWEPLGRADAAFGAAAGFGAVTATLGYGASVIFRQTQDREWTWVARSMVAVAIALGFGTYGILSARDSSRQVVAEYCAYGAVSQAQLEGCKDHVGFSDVEEANTPAARFALGSEEEECGSGSGPFCQAVSRRRRLEETQPD